MYEIRKTRRKATTKKKMSKQWWETEIKLENPEEDNAKEIDEWSNEKTNGWFENDLPTSDTALTKANRTKGNIYEKRGMSNACTSDNSAMNAHCLAL